MSVTTRGELGTLHEVAAGLYAYVQPEGTWCVNNTGFVRGREAVLVIDSCATERRTLAFREAIRATTELPIRLLVNTHYHIDHVNGNGLLRPAAIVGHERCRQRMLTPAKPPPAHAVDPVDWGAIDPVPPNVTLTDRLDVWVDERRLELRHFGRRAHTDNDVVVWVPDERVLFTGDLVMHSSMPLVMDGSVRGILQTLRELLALEPAVVVPGHGDVGGIELLHEQIRFYELIWRIAEQAREAGTSALEAARAADLGEFADLLDGERLVANLHRAIAELDNPGIADMDMVPVFGDMVAFNGGPLRCVA